MTAWFEDPDLLVADCGAEDRFVYTLATALGRDQPGAPPHRPHAFAQALLDRAAERRCLPTDLSRRELARIASSMGMGAAVVRVTLALLHPSGGSAHGDDCAFNQVRRGRAAPAPPARELAA